MKYQFLNEVYYKDLENGKFELVNELRASTPYGLIAVPKGFITDLASVPWIAQIIIPKIGKQNRSSIIHDYLYQTGNINGNKITRKIADKIYLGLMQSRKVPKWNRNTQYSGLRVGGWYTWNKYRREEKRKVVLKH